MDALTETEKKASSQVRKAVQSVKVSSIGIVVLAEDWVGNSCLDSSFHVSCSALELHPSTK